MLKLITLFLQTLRNGNITKMYPNILRALRLVLDDMCFCISNCLALNHCVSTS